jgi:uncharacterized membrane protein
MVNKLAGVVYIAVGLFLTPFFIGIAIIILGIWHLSRKD